MKLTKEQATEIIMRTKSNQVKLERLMKWDDSLTLFENAENLGVSSWAARGLSNRWRVKFTLSPNVGSRRYNTSKRNTYVNKWDSNLTIEQNAKKLGVTYAFASNVANNYGLSYTKVYKSGLRIIAQAKSRQAFLRDQMKDLRDNKRMTLNQIGKVYGVTRERVRQILI